MALEIPVTTLVIPWADASDPAVMLPSGLVLIYSAQFRITNVPAFTIIWEDNKPKFTPADRIVEQAHSTSHPGGPMHPGGPGRPGDA